MNPWRCTKCGHFSATDIYCHNCGHRSADADHSHHTGMSIVGDGEEWMDEQEPGVLVWPMLMGGLLLVGVVVYLIGIVAGGW